LIFSSPSDAADCEDQDGFLTRDEFGTASKGYFDLLDKDGDGKFSREEHKSGFALMPRIRIVTV
jgi:hypothetical protein